jgi:hypothetical protein
MRRRRRAQLPRRRQLGRRLDHAGDDQRGQPQRPLRQQPVKTDPAQRAKHRSNVAMRQRPLNLTTIRRSEKRLTAQHPPERLDLGIRPMREVGECAALDLAALAPVLAQEHGGR